MRSPGQRLLSRRFRHTTDFIQNRTRLDARYPEIRLPFALTHARFQRLATNRLMREYPDVNLTLAMQKVRSCHTARFNLTARYPAGSQRLYTIFTKRDKVAFTCVAFDLAPLMFTVFYSFGH